MATSEGIPSSIDIEFLELNDNPYTTAINKIEANSTKNDALYSMNGIKLNNVVDKGIYIKNNKKYIRK